MSGDEISDAIGDMLEGALRSKPTRACCFPEAGPIPAGIHDRVPDEVIECEGGRYVLDYAGLMFSGYRWEADDDAAPHLP